MKKKQKERKKKKKKCRILLANPATQKLVIKFSETLPSSPTRGNGRFFLLLLRGGGHYESGRHQSFTLVRVAMKAYYYVRIAGLVYYYFFHSQGGGGVKDTLGPPWLLPCRRVKYDHC